jgi:hypothetical protein
MYSLIAIQRCIDHASAAWYPKRDRFTSSRTREIVMEREVNLEGRSLKIA